MSHVVKQPSGLRSAITSQGRCLQHQRTCTATPSKRSRKSTTAGGVLVSSVFTGSSLPRRSALVTVRRDVERCDGNFLFLIMGLLPPNDVWSSTSAPPSVPTLVRPPLFPAPPPPPPPLSSSRSEVPLDASSMLRGDDKEANSRRARVVPRERARGGGGKGFSDDDTRRLAGSSAGGLESPEAFEVDAVESATLPPSLLPPSAPPPPPPSWPPLAPPLLARASLPRSRLVVLSRRPPEPNPKRGWATASTCGEGDRFIASASAMDPVASDVPSSCTPAPDPLRGAVPVGFAETRPRRRCRRNCRLKPR